MIIKKLKEVQYEVSGNEMKILLGKRNIALSSEDGVFPFIPIEGKEILVDIKSGNIKNLSETLYFRKPGEFVNYTLEKLVSISNLYDFIDEQIKQLNSINKQLFNIELEAIMNQIENRNIDFLIDKALDNRDQQAFHSLIAMKA